MAVELNYAGFKDTLVILGAAGIVIPAFTRFRISPIIGFILVGLAVGPAGLGSLATTYPWLNYVTITDRAAIEPFAEFGIVLLLFGIGLELSFRRLWTMRTMVFGVGAAELLISALLLAVGVSVFGQGWSGSLALGLALALSSTAIVLPLVGTTSAVGRSALGMLLFEDLAIVPIIFALGALAPFAAAGGFGGLVTTMALGALVIAVMLVLGRWVLPPLFAQAARTKSPELFLAASLLVVIAASLATTAVGLSPIMGALLAGILIAETDYHSEVEVITAPFRGLALGIFLITVGMSVDLRVVAASWETILFAMVAVMLVKTVVTAGFLVLLSGARKGVAAEVGVLMASPSETTVDCTVRRGCGSADQCGYGRILADRDRARPHLHAAARQAWPGRGTPGRYRRGRRTAPDQAGRSRAGRRDHRLWPRRPARRRDAAGAWPPVSRCRLEHRHGRRLPPRRRADHLRRRRPPRTGRPTQPRPRLGADPDDG
jgi:CPA2 family monovalent cation:H+ antiporter-2